ncbi:MAG: Nif11-like leader peptide family RiPP precursor [Acidobacteriota bacterium]|nr:Nif11-like leader peptide family RiPP precursor [Acidobacteriota bacterium]
MSKQIDAFFEAVKRDEQLRRELQESASEDAFFHAAVRRGAEHGYAFTVDEVRQASRGTQMSGELSEQALAGISGGQFQEVTSWRFCTWEWLGC